MLLLFGSAFSAYATAQALTSGSIAITPIQIGSFLNGNVLVGPGERRQGARPRHGRHHRRGDGLLRAAAAEGLAMVAVTAGVAGRGAATWRRPRRRGAPWGCAGSCWWWPPPTSCCRSTPRSRSPSRARTALGGVHRHRRAAPGFADAFTLSLTLAVVTTVITLVLIVPTAIYVHLRLPRVRRLFEGITILPDRHPAGRADRRRAAGRAGHLEGHAVPAGARLRRARHAVRLPLPRRRAARHRR